MDSWALNTREDIFKYESTKTNKLIQICSTFVEHVVKPVLLCIVLYFYCKKALINTIDREPFFTGSPQITLMPHVDLFMGGFSCHTETANALLENVVAQLDAPHYYNITST